MKVAVEVGINRDNVQEIGFLLDMNSFHTFFPRDSGEPRGIDFHIITQLVMAEAISAKVQVELTYLHQESKIIEVPMNLPWP